MSAQVLPGIEFPKEPAFQTVHFSGEVPEDIEQVMQERAKALEEIDRSFVSIVRNLYSVDHGSNHGSEPVYPIKLVMMQGNEGNYEPGVLIGGTIYAMRDCNPEIGEIVEHIIKDDSFYLFIK